MSTEFDNKMRSSARWTSFGEWCLMLAIVVPLVTIILGIVEVLLDHPKYLLGIVASIPVVCLLVWLASRCDRMSRKRSDEASVQNAELCRPF